MTKRRRRPQGRRSQQPSSNGRLYRLAVCLILFTATFLGRSALPDKLTQVFRSNTDFAAAFSVLGESLSLGEPVGESLTDFAVTVFGAAPVETPAYIPLPDPTPIPTHQPTLRILQAPTQTPVQIGRARV